MASQRIETSDIIKNVRCPATYSLSDLYKGQANRSIAFNQVYKQNKKNLLN